jgi:hypothetical protein
MSFYAQTYGDFTIVDGTHNTTAYDLKLMPFTNVDCLGKCVVTGVLLDESENAETVSNALSLFSLAIPGATLMTDGGSAYPSVAVEAKMNHILCIQHFQQQIFSSCHGVGSMSDSFKKDAMALLYSSFDEQTFECFAKTSMQKYSEFSSATDCLEKIVKNKHKICRTFTGKIQPCLCLFYGCHQIISDCQDASLPVPMSPHSAEKASIPSLRKRV